MRPNAVAKRDSPHLFVSELEKGSQETTSHRAATGPTESRAVTVQLWRIYIGTVLNVHASKVFTVQKGTTLNITTFPLTGTTLLSTVGIMEVNWPPSPNQMLYTNLVGLDCTE